MKVLWIVNGATKKIANVCSINGGGISWISSIIDEVKVFPGIRLVYAFPQNQIKKMICEEYESVKCYGFFQSKKNPWKKNKNVKDQIGKIIGQEKPDIIHIWGTEFAHVSDAYDYIEEEGMCERTLVYIQGIVNFIGKKYFAGVPTKNCISFTLRDLIRWDNIFLQKQKFLIRGKNESKVLLKAMNVLGRTDFDKEYILSVNKHVNYFFCNESVREVFHHENWEYSCCDKNTVFVTQGYYPIKGFHFLIRAIGIVKKAIPEIKVLVAGENIIYQGIERIRESSYGRYIRKLIQQENVSDCFIFLGVLDEEQMAHQFRKANIYVLPSVIENSPNSLAEALTVGTPSIATRVGGIPNMVEDGVDSILYDYDNIWELAEKIIALLSDKELCNAMSEAAKKKAKKRYSAKENVDLLIKIYQSIC